MHKGYSERTGCGPACRTGEIFRRCKGEPIHGKGQTVMLLEPIKVLRNADALHGVKAPKWEVLTEQPWHRAAAYMFARGATTKEVATATEHTAPAVSNLLRQQWFQERVTTLMADSGKDVMDLFKAEQVNSFLTLVEIRDNPKAAASVRRASCIDILDRVQGRPTQRVEHSSIKPSSDPHAEARQLEESNERLRASTFKL